jgi:hypothetical protein
MSLVDERGSAEIPWRGCALSRILGVALMGFFLLLPILMAGCGDEGSEKASPPEPTTAAANPPAPKAAPGARTTPDDLPLALVLGLSAFAERAPDAKGPPEPLPAELEFISRRGGKWVKTTLTDPDSNVFHKAMAYEEPDGTMALLTGGGTRAIVKLWTMNNGVLTPRTIWEKDFGGRFSRIRDMEVGDVYGDGSRAIVVATHDQGVVAVIRPKNGDYEVEEIDHDKNTFVHEIELGDLDGDGVTEIYATPSEPNRLDGSAQSGRVVRYTPAKGEGRVVVADLGDRHAKEILVDDIDGDGRDELYVVVEGQPNPNGPGLLHRTEIWRYEADTPPDKGAVIAEIDDSLGRFLTPSDLDGDGKKEIVAALFKSGVWWLRPGKDPMKPWSKKSIDRHSSSFEHAAIATDLDGDGLQELYVASDNDKALRRYVWNGRRLVKEDISKRNDNRSVLTWNIMPIPIELVPDHDQ